MMNRVFLQHGSVQIAELLGQIGPGVRFSLFPFGDISPPVSQKRQSASHDQSDKEHHDKNRAERVSSGPESQAVDGIRVYPGNRLV